MLPIVIKTLFNKCNQIYLGGQLVNIHLKCILFIGKCFKISTYFWQRLSSCVVPVSRSGLEDSFPSQDLKVEMESIS